MLKLSIFYTIKVTDSFCVFLFFFVLSSEHASTAEGAQPSRQPQLVSATDQWIEAEHGSDNSYQMLTNVMFSKEEDESCSSGSSSDGGKFQDFIISALRGTELHCFFFSKQDMNRALETDTV